MVFIFIKLTIMEQQRQRTSCLFVELK